MKTNKEVLQDIERAPSDDLILNAMRGISREAQECLTRTKWKDGIDITVPNISATEFAERLTESYRVRIKELSIALREDYFELHEQVGSARQEIERLNKQIKAFHEGYGYRAIEKERDGLLDALRRVQDWMHIETPEGVRLAVHHAIKGSERQQEPVALKEQLIGVTVTGAVEDRLEQIGIHSHPKTHKDHSEKHDDCLECGED